MNAMSRHTLAAFYDNLKRRHASLAETGEIGLPPNGLFLNPEDLRAILEQPKRIELRALGKTAAATDEDFAIPGGDATVNERGDRAVEGSDSGRPIATLPDGRVSARISPLFLFSTAERSTDIAIQSRSTRNFHGNFNDFAVETVTKPEPLIVAETPGIAERVGEIVREFAVNISPDSIRVGCLSGGFELPAAKLTVYTEKDIFGETVSSDRAPSVSVTQARKPRFGAFISDFRDLKPGDFVVHVDHGLGKFEGLQTITSQGAEREFMLLIYADDAKLFVPVERVDLVSRYSSGEPTEP